MSALPQPERHDIVIANLRPREVWEHVASSNKQYILIGDGDHRDPSIPAHVAPVVSLLAFDGMKYLGLEWQKLRYQGIIDNFNNASQSSREAKADLREINTQFTIFPLPESGGNASVSEKFRACNCALLYTARRHGVKLAALNDMRSFDEMMPDESEQQRERFMRAYRHYYNHEELPGWLGVGEAEKLVRYTNAYIDYNLSLDATRARDFKVIVGPDRGGLMFGSRHFRGMNSNGIDAFLPESKIAYVLLGASETVQRHLENERKLAIRQPDFVIATDLALGWATPSAVRHGLF